MLVYDEVLPVLSDEFTGDEVAILAARGGRVDRAFRRSYAWAKHALATGELKRLTVVVELNRDSWVHTLGAVNSALSGERLPVGAAFKVDAPVDEIGGQKLTNVLDALNELTPPVVPVVPASKVKLEPKPEPVKDEKKEGE
ncbi:hypothetical protein [Mycolicibacterium sphagni]|uniref:Uncharacterized protein n=1 Tax=Mycolicibacterium sphagni TaxID=1786 RepID=A0A255E166_9MYCO|nr:hypothetical protein [Mycolicibacterium sphagni]OYN81793.1 hypothetical protein CG716_05475 [Mycolicibacterium sphagni]